MVIKDKHYETIWLKEGKKPYVQIIDQRFLPFKFVISDLKNVEDVYHAIKEMKVRGAPLIGAAAALGMMLAVNDFKGRGDELDEYLKEKAAFLNSSRPTAVNLSMATGQMQHAINNASPRKDPKDAARKAALDVISSERENCKNIGNFGLPLIEKIASEKKDVVNILTHCNAGWLACIDYGTATAPIYMAHDKGIKVHVWVDETRPRNQGSKLTAWELQQHGVPCTIITDNAGGHLMQHGMVDLVITGCDRATINGDAANKTGTYLKALAARDNGIPFYVALPSSSIDWTMQDGLKEIPIEERDADEIKYIQGKLGNRIVEVRITDENSRAANYAFDVTPARLITALITEKGICKTEKNSILELFPEKRMFI